MWIDWEKEFYNETGAWPTFGNDENGDDIYRVDYIIWLEKKLTQATEKCKDLEQYSKFD